MTKNDKATYESYDRDEFDEPPVGPVGVHRGSRSAASRVLPYVVVLVVAALVGALAWGVSTGELGKMIESWRPTQSQQADTDRKAGADDASDASDSSDGKADAADDDADAAQDGSSDDAQSADGSADTQDQTGQNAADGSQDAADQNVQEQGQEPNRATSVRVVNGSGIAGYAGQQAAVLQQVGYTSVEAANPVTETLPAGNVVWYQNETDLATANDVAATLGIADVQQVSGLVAPVVVMLVN